MESPVESNAGERITASHLRQVAYAPRVRRISRLPAEALDRAIEEIVRHAPAGHAPALVLTRLVNDSRPAGGVLPLSLIQQDIQHLFAGLAASEAPPDSPASVLWAYNQLLRLAGFDPHEAFPQGAWQVYGAYGLRDDLARHTCETDGFDSFLNRSAIPLPPPDRLAALLLAACACLHGYPLLLENAWRERVSTRLLFETSVLQTCALQTSAPQTSAPTPGAPTYETLFREWEIRQPHLASKIEPDLAGVAAVAARRRAAFETFLAESTLNLPAEQRAAWQERLQAAEQRELPAYLRQMNMLAYLEPGLHGEMRHSLPLSAAQVGVVVRGAYYLLPVCDPSGAAFTDLAAARALAGEMLAGTHPSTGLSALTSLARVRRSALPSLRALFSADTLSALDALRTAPLLINLASPGGTGSLGRSQQGRWQTSWPLNGPRSTRQPLARLRLGERGLGDHPLTLFDSGSSLIFDASAGFFDPAWSVALAEIFTTQAAAWALRLSQQPADEAPAPSASPAPRAVVVRFQSHEAELIHAAPSVDSEACAESDSVQVRPALQLRALCKQNPGLPQLAVNDLLVLYRALHALDYRPPSSLIADLQELARVPNPTSRTGALIASATRAALEGLQSKAQETPNLLVFFDISPRGPAERQKPLNLSIPVSALDLPGLHRRALDAMRASQTIGAAQECAPLPGPYQAAILSTGQAEPGDDFLQARGAYLEALSSFGAVMQRLREAVLVGETPFVEEVHLPEALNGMLRTLPGRYDLFTELLDGDEMFTNLGMAAPVSSLSRFLPARDDDPRRRLVWGVLTSATGVMHITLRDFRPHVGRLHAAGLRDVADRITQDYLDAFARGFNRFVYDLTKIIRA